MEPDQESAFNEAVKVSAYAEAVKNVTDRLIDFIDFIEYCNPEVSRLAATQTAAFVFQNLPAAFVETPEMMQQLKAIALHFSQT